MPGRQIITLCDEVLKFFFFHSLTSRSVEHRLLTQCALVARYARSERRIQYDGGYKSYHFMLENAYLPSAWSLNLQTRCQILKSNLRDKIMRRRVEVERK